MNDTEENNGLEETAEEPESSTLTDEDYYARVDEHLKLWQNNLAQEDLDCVKEKNGKRHYYQSKIYKQKQWYNEQYKELKAALKIEPDNEEYNKAMQELEEFRKSGQYKEYKKQKRDGQMGGVCFEVCGECCCTVACECLCEGLAGGC